MDEGTIVTVMQSMVKSCPDCVKATTNGGDTPLHVACDEADHSSTSVILYLAEMYAKALKMKEMEDGSTPLDVAVATRQASKSLLHLLLVSTNIGDYSPLYFLCAKFGNRFSEDWFMGVLRTFACSKKVILATDSLGRTPPHMLFSQSVPRERLPALIDKCPESAQARDIGGNTPLHTAIVACSARLLRPHKKCARRNGFLLD